MQKEIMIGQIPVVIRGKNDEISGLTHNQASLEQGYTNVAAADNILAVSRENYNINESDENSKEVSSAGQNSQPESSSRKRMRHYRHTKSQIDAMEALFKECPHPDDSQRKELACILGLDPIQVKFWFQNKRTHTKSHNERKNNNELRAENEKLAAENLSCKKALGDLPCHKCGANAVVPEIPTSLQQLRLENTRLIEQIEHMKRITSKYVDKSILESSIFSDSSSSPSQTVATEVAGNMLSEDYISHLMRFVESNVPLIKEVAAASMGELIKKTEAVEQLWSPNGEGSGYVLNEEEYFKAFPTVLRRNGSKWKNEGSMRSANVMASPLEVVEVYMDMTKWLAVYPNFVSKAMSLYQLSTTEREGNKDGDLQLICAEFQLSCPIVPTRKFIFMRYCKQLAQEIWAIVDVSLDNILPKIPYDPLIKCLKWPSGCIIQELLSGFSKVTWVEHVAVNDEVVHHLVEPIHQSGVLYGASRWMSTLERQCERIAYTFSQTNRENVDGVVARQEGSTMIVLKLSERMCREFFSGATTFNSYGWTYVSGDGVDDVKIMKQDNVSDTRMPFGVVLSASLCVQLPIPSKMVFDFLRNTATRAEWDILCNGAEIVQETCRIATGPEENGVSVLRVHGNEEQKNMVILQETSTELTSSSLIFAPLNVDSMMKLLSDDTKLEKIGILPSGFTIIPTELPTPYPEATPFVGTLLNASFQILISPFPCVTISDNSIDIMKIIVKTALQNINNALMERIV